MDDEGRWHSRTSYLLFARLEVATKTTHELLELAVLANIVLDIIRLGIGLLLLLCLRFGSRRGGLVGEFRGTRRLTTDGLGGVDLGVPLSRGGKDILLGDGQGGGDSSRSHWVLDVLS